MERWLRSDPVPTLNQLHRLVDHFAGEVVWLDNPVDWKARFTLACAMQELGDAMDEYFVDVCEGSSLEMSRRMRAMVEERIMACDEGGALGREHTFFAARLLQMRLQAEGRWHGEVVPRVPSGTKKFGEDATDEEIEDYRRSLFWGMNQGNWLLEWVKKEAAGTPNSCV